MSLAELAELMEEVGGPALDGMSLAEARDALGNSIEENPGAEHDHDHGHEDEAAGYICLFYIQTTSGARAAPATRRPRSPKLLALEGQRRPVGPALCCRRVAIRKAGAARPAEIIKPRDRATFAARSPRAGGVNGRFQLLALELGEVQNAGGGHVEAAPVVDRRRRDVVA